MTRIKVGTKVRVTKSSHNASQLRNVGFAPDGVYSIKTWMNEEFDVVREVVATYYGCRDEYTAYLLAFNGNEVGCVYEKALEVVKPKMFPFDLKRALAGDEVVTRDGVEARGLDDLKDGTPHPICADLGEGWCDWFGEDGTNINETSHDLFMKYETKGKTEELKEGDKCFAWNKDYRKRDARIYIGRDGHGNALTARKDHEERYANDELYVAMPYRNAKPYIEPTLTVDGEVKTIEEVKEILKDY